MITTFQQHQWKATDTWLLQHTGCPGFQKHPTLHKSHRLQIRMGRLLAALEAKQVIVQIEIQELDF